METYLMIFTAACGGLSALVSLGAMLVAINVMRNGNGQAARRADEKIELALQRFAVVLDEKLASRFAALVSREMLDLRLKLVEEGTAAVDHKVSNLRLIMDGMRAPGPPNLPA